MKIGIEGIDMLLCQPKWAEGFSIPQPKTQLLFLWCALEITVHLSYTQRFKTTHSNSKSETIQVISEHIFTALLVYL